MKGAQVSQLFRVQEFAQFTGITVRTLHHYDRLGLLRPHRNRSGYRLYYLRDVERLEQIGALLERDSRALPDALRRQRQILEDKRRLLDRAIRALREAEQRPETAVLKQIIDLMEMQNDTDWMKKYYSGEGWAKMEQRRPQWSPELQERVSREWTELFRDVEAALGEDPAGAKAQALAARWMGLVEEFTGADRDVTAGVSNVWADRQNWPAEFQEQAAPYANPKVWEFMGKVLGWKA